MEWWYERKRVTEYENTSLNLWQQRGQQKSAYSFKKVEGLYSS